MAKVSLRAYNREIETMIDRGQLDEAIAHCHHILKTFPKHLETYRLLGKAYLEYKRYGDAADIFSRVLVSVPNDFVAQVGMSIIRDEENKLNDAIWHMERAFETQPSNSAIQSELQRLYGRRDGVQPPRIRMTRGALAHMYVQGELYPQAISEIKSVLKEDPDRFDMQALLARACYKSGLKNEAADVASGLLRSYPYSLDANRVLVEIVGADRPENAQAYRQRVVELDPYAAQVTDTIFQSNEVSDAAVNIERLDWNGQPVGMQSDWAETKAIGLESGAARDEQPDWLKKPANEMSSPPLSQPTSASIFDTSFQPEQTPAQPAEDIPEFMRAAGWGQSTGAFDESKPVVTEPESAPAQPIEHGDLPDWVKAMKPAETPAQEEPEEELPDWINKIGTGALASQASDQPDWMNQLEQPSESSAPATEEQADWLKGLGGEPESGSPGAQADELDWLKGVGDEPEPTPSAVQPDELDWLKSLGNEPEATASAESTNELDWLKGLGDEPVSTPSAAQTDEPDWLKGFASETESAFALPAQEDQPDWLDQPSAEVEPAPSTLSSTDFDFLDQLTEEPILQTPTEPESMPAATNVDNLGVSEQERDDSFAWLESLAAKQGASEGLLTKPEDRLEEEPDWVRRAKGLSTSQPTPPSSVEQPTSEPSASLDELGKSEQEQDDSFAWLENLAAKQGASEGLLTKPEERLEEAPEWVKQAKDVGSQQAPVTPTPPAANLEELGKSEQERDDSFAWLENLAAKQGASEGLLTKPEDRLEQEPDWVRQAKDLDAQQSPLSVTPQAEQEPEQPVSMDETAAWLSSLDEEEKASEPASALDETVLESEQTVSMDETAAWLSSLDEEEKASKPAPAIDETAMWLKSLDKEEPAPVEPVESVDKDMPAWMQNIEKEEVTAAESIVPAQAAEEESTEWLRPAEGPAPFGESKSEEEVLPSWLNELDKEEPISAPAGDDDLPAWLRGEEVAPEKPEPTLATDWKPETVQSAEPAPLPSLSLDILEEKLAEVQDEQPVREPETVKQETQEPTAVPEPYREPVTRSRGPGTLVMPSADPMLGLARDELSRSNVPGALESYGKLIKKARFLDEVIHDLREALYRYPVEVSIWQSLGDAYMRANRLQDALDAYTKAEELLR